MNEYIYTDKDLVVVTQLAYLTFTNGKNVKLHIQWQCCIKYIHPLS
jgi:hypothetical protein